MNLSINYLRMLRETNSNLFNHYFKITGHSLRRGYVRSFGLANKLARVQLTIPYVGLADKLRLNGRDTIASRGGFGDLGIPFGISLPDSPFAFFCAEVWERTKEKEKA